MTGASARDHHERMERGVAAVRVYLQAQFPDYVVEALERGSHDLERHARTFRVRRDSEQYLLRVTDEVLDIDTEGVDGIFQKFGVASALRQVGSMQSLVVSTHGTRVEPV